LRSAHNTGLVRRPASRSASMALPEQDDAQVAQSDAEEDDDKPLNNKAAAAPDDDRQPLMLRGELWPASAAAAAATAPAMAMVAQGVAPQAATATSFCQMTAWRQSN